MRFTRPATPDDFKGLDIQYDYGGFMSENVKQKLEEGDFKGGVILFSKETGMNMMRSRPYCQTYRTYLHAKRDFEAGKPVFVSYD